MNTSILMVTLTTTILAGHSPSWQTSYAQAMQMSAAQKKPVAVVFAPAGWTKLVRDNSPSVDVAKLLADQFIPYYVDTTSPAGKSLAQEFELKGTTGLVLSDKTGASQAFWHQGDMDSQRLVGYLRKYANPDLVVRTTETVSARVSDYPAANPAPAANPVVVPEPVSAPATTNTLTWVNNYHQAQEMGTTQRRPLAVVFGTGADGWSKSGPSATVEGLLADNYVGVYIDTNNPEGKKLAESFAINGKGLVLSDRTGTSQAFWHQGDLSNQQMVSYLTKFSDPQVAVRGTETVNSSSARQSNYAPVNFGGTPFDSSYCPSCNNARGRR